jgi:putative transposase
MIEPENNDLSLVKQCNLLQIRRSGLYYVPTRESQENLHLMRKMDEQYLKTPFYGVRRLTEWLKKNGYDVNHKRTWRLMELMNWQTLYCKRNTSKRNKEHVVYPYLLRGLKINRANQVWAIDITYIPMRRGFMYLCAIIDVHTRYVVNWGISNTMTAEWCKQITQQAIEMHGKPEIINSDQGSQFTSPVHINLLESYEIKPSMDGKGRAIDNIFIERLWRSVKYECVYLHAFEDGVQLYEGLNKYFEFYNYERFHQSLDYDTPASQYHMAA